MNVQTSRVTAPASTASSKSKPFACNYYECTRAYSREDNLLRHKQSEHGHQRSRQVLVKDGEFKCQVEGCQVRPFNSIYKLKQHIKSHATAQIVQAGYSEKYSRRCEKMKLKLEEREQRAVRQSDDELDKEEREPLSKQLPRFKFPLLYSLRSEAVIRE